MGWVFRNKELRIQGTRNNNEDTTTTNNAQKPQITPTGENAILTNIQ